MRKHEPKSNGPRNTWTRAKKKQMNTNYSFKKCVKKAKKNGCTKEQLEEVYEQHGKVLTKERWRKWTQLI